MKFPYLQYSSLILPGAAATTTNKAKPKSDIIENTGRPNVLFILADDQRADALGCAGNRYETFGTGKRHNEKSAFERSFKKA